MKSTIFAVITGMILAGCGSKSKTNAKSAPPSRQGTVASSFEARFLDADPAVSADGVRAVFTSGRETDRPQRIFRVDRSGTGKPEALTGQEDLGIEFLPTISPDGQWVSFSAIKDGASKVFVTSFDGASLLEINLPNLTAVSLDGMRFSAGSPPLLAVQYEASDRAQALAIVKLTTASGVISAADVVLQEGVVTSEGMPRWAKASPFELVTMDRRATDSRFVTRSFADASVATVTRAEEGADALASMMEAPFFAAGDERFYVGKLAQGSRSVVPVGDLVKEDGTSGVGEVVVKNELRRFREGEAAASFESQQFNVLAVDGTSDGAALVTLGTEYFACQHKQFYGTTIVVHDAATKAWARLIPVWDANDQKWSITSDPCSVITEENKKETIVDAAFQRMAVAGSSSQPKIVYQSFFFGDPEILEMTFDWNGSVTSNAAVTNLSTNHAE